MNDELPPGVISQVEEIPDPDEKPLKTVTRRDALKLIGVTSIAGLVGGFLGKKPIEAFLNTENASRAQIYLQTQIDSLNDSIGFKDINKRPLNEILNSHEDSRVQEFIKHWYGDKSEILKDFQLIGRGKGAPFYEDPALTNPLRYLGNQLILSRGHAVHADNLSENNVIKSSILVIQKKDTLPEDFDIAIIPSQELSDIDVSFLIKGRAIIGGYDNATHGVAPSSTWELYFKVSTDVMNNNHYSMVPMTVG